MQEFETICRENYGRIYNYVLGMLGNEEATQDIVQDTFLIAYAKGKEFLIHENKIGFLYKTARNLVMENIRREKKEQPLETEKINIKSMDAYEQMKREHYDKVDEMQYKEIVLSALNSKESILYEEYYVKKRKMKEIAADVGISETALRMKYVRLRMKIKKAVGELKLNDF